MLESGKIARSLHLLGVRPEELAETGAPTAARLGLARIKDAPAVAELLDQLAGLDKWDLAEVRRKLERRGAGEEPPRGLRDVTCFKAMCPGDSRKGSFGVSGRMVQEKFELEQKVRAHLAEAILKASVGKSFERSLESARQLGAGHLAEEIGRIEIDCRLSDAAWKLRLSEGSSSASPSPDYALDYVDQAKRSLEVVREMDLDPAARERLADLDRDASEKEKAKIGPAIDHHLDLAEHWAKEGVDHTAELEKAERLIARAEVLGVKVEVEGALSRIDAALKRVPEGVQLGKKALPSEPTIHA